MNRTKYIPAIITLMAALVVCLAMYIYKYSTGTILVYTFVTCIIALIIGSIVRKIVEKYLVISTMVETDMENAEGEEGAEGENGESAEEKTEADNTKEAE